MSNKRRIIFFPGLLLVFVGIFVGCQKNEEQEIDMTNTEKVQQREKLIDDILNIDPNASKETLNEKDTSELETMFEELKQNLQSFVLQNGWKDENLLSLKISKYNPPRISDT